MESVEIDDDVKAFLVESYENLNQIEQDIINLETNYNNEEILGRIYRSVHSIKGNCGFLPFPKLESVAHAGENLLGCLRDRRLAVNSSIITALLQSVDTIRQLLTQIEAEGNEGNDDYSTLLQALTDLQETPPSPPSPPSPSSPPAYSQSHSPLETSESSIRVNVDLLDRVMNLVGELVLARNQIAQLCATEKDTAFTTTCQRLSLITTELHEGVMKTRMQPISTIWQKFPRAIRDLAFACGKQVQVEMAGAETELDKSIIEAIKDPLTHLVRNCIDHGIETPDVRVARGKPVAGQLSLRAFHESGKVNIEISDDGKGIDPEQIKQKAQQLAAIAAAQAADLSESDAVNLIFLPGFSTAKQVTNLSGRGVGMDVVKANIEKINGKVDVHSKLGQGTTFKIKIPLTLAIIPALIVVSGGARYAIPQTSLQELVRLEGQALNGIEILYDVPVYRLRGKILPLLYLNRELQLEDTTTDRETVNIVAIGADDYQFGLIVDAIEDTLDIVVKPLGRQLKHISTFAGATILGDGKVALIIDAIGLANRAGVSQIQKRWDNTAAMPEQADNRQMVLLFHGPQGARMGITLDLASRLEEFPSTAVEKVGNQYVVQYRGNILSLIDLHAVFGIDDSPIPQADINHSNDDTLQVVVISFNQEQSYGLVVDRILDIVEESLTIKGTASRPGILYLALIQGQVTEILDVESVIRIVNPHLLQFSS